MNFLTPRVCNKSPMTEMCLGCLVDTAAHNCGYEPAPMIPESWRK